MVDSGDGWMETSVIVPSSAQQAGQTRDSLAGPSRVPPRGSTPFRLTGGKGFGLLAGPVFFAVLLLLPPPAGMEAAAWRTAAVAGLMAVWWITEAIPIPATALLPLVFFPLLGIANINGAAAPYANPIIFLFMGGFMIALAMQRWELHRRIALMVILAVGTEPIRLIGGFMIAAAFLSMWVSNTATAVMMLPIGLSVVDLALVRKDGSVRPAGESNFAVALMLGIAYGCSIGGLGTLIGTPPNALLAGFMAETYGVRIGFGEWMLLGVPMVVLGLPLTWFVLTRVVYPVTLREIPGGHDVISRELQMLGRWSRGEVRVAVIFVVAATLWITQPLLAPVIPQISDAGIAIAAALALFLTPIDIRKGVFALDWETANKLPWAVLILFGGGLSLAAAITSSGLADWIGLALGGLAVLPTLVLLGLVVAVIIFLTELTSNTATAAAFLPVLAALAVGMGLDPLVLVVPAALAASGAFMLPVATPPNAIVYGSSFVTIPQMARAGVILNVIFTVLISVICYALVLAVFAAG
jgi:solute carrier family 13 (sodium-dependent dicarboxylate transporter), member 2/3/5